MNLHLLLVLILDRVRFDRRDELKKKPACFVQKRAGYFWLT